MRSSVIPALGTAATGLFGIAMPVAFPNLDPSYGEAMLVVAGTLLVVTIVLWLSERLSKSDETGAQHGATASSGGSAVIQQHSGTGHNINAQNLHVGPRLLQMDEGTMEGIASALTTERPVALAFANYGRTLALKDKLVSYLEARGFVVNEVVRFGFGYSPRMRKPLDVSSNGFEPQPGLIICDGMQVVAIDGDMLIE